MAQQPIVVVGAGFGGLTAAKALGRLLGDSPQHPVTLVDQHEYHEIKPKIPEALGEWIDCAVQVPIAEALAGQPVRFVQATVEGLDVEGQQLLTSEGALPYWRLVWALGGQPDFSPGGQTIPGLEQVAIAPYSFGQACRLRHRLGEMAQYAAGLASPAGRRPYLTIVVAGGGFVGVEVAGELMDRLHWLAARLGLPRQEMRLVLVEPRRQLLGFDQQLGASALAQLRAKGVEVRLGVGVVRAQRGRVELSDGTVVESQTLVWTGGLRGHPLAQAAGLPTDGRGRIDVNATLRVLEHPSIYAIGDGAALPALDQRPDLASSGQAAVDQGLAVAQALRAEVDGQAPRPYQPRGRGVVVLLGHREAIARVGQWAPLRGIAPWLKQAPILEHLWRLGGARLVARHWGSTLLPLLAPSRVDRYTLAGDGPQADQSAASRPPGQAAA